MESKGKACSQSAVNRSIARTNQGLSNVLRCHGQTEDTVLTEASSEKTAGLESEEMWTYVYAR